MKLPSVEEFKENFNSPIWQKAAEIICERHSLPVKNLRRAEHGESVVFLIDDEFVIKIYIPQKKGLEREKNALELAKTSLKIPQIIAFNEIENYKYLVTTQIKGESLNREKWLLLNEREQIQILSQLAEGLKELHQSDFSKVDFNWENFLRHQVATCYERQKKCQVNATVLAEIPKYLEVNLPLLPTNFKESFLHGCNHPVK
jgi:aminoglycoside phosphotransferase